MGDALKLGTTRNQLAVFDVTLFRVCARAANLTML